MLSYFFVVLRTLCHFEENSLLKVNPFRNCFYFLYAQKHV